MDKAQLLKFIESPASINKSVLPKLVEAIKKYPYCQSLQILLAKHLYDVKSSHASGQLAKASAYAGNREVLYELIRKGTAQQPSTITTQKTVPAAEKTIAKEPEKKIVTQKKPQVIKKEEKKEPIQPVKKEVTPPKQQTPQPQPKPAQTNASSNDADDKKRLLQEQIKQRLSEISNKKSATDDTSDNKDEKKKPELNQTGKPLSNNEIIDNFIKKEPRITKKPDEEIPKGDLSKESIENENFISETLAQIYDKQGKHEKAIETYKKLILKFPEKSTYFANQIEIIKQKNK